MSNTGTARHHMHSFCVYVLLLFQSPCCCLPFSFIFFLLLLLLFSPTPTTCLFQEILQDVSASAGTHFLIPIRFACWLNRPPPLSCSLSTYRRLPAACCLPACSRGTIIINSTISNSIVSLSRLHLHSPLQLAVNLNAPWRLSLLPFYVIRFFLFSHRSTAQQQPQHLMHSQC